MPTAGFCFWTKYIPCYIPPLFERAADISDIFDHMLEKAVSRSGLHESPSEFLQAEHYEMLICDGLKEGNARELVDVADRITTRIKTGTKPKKAIAQIFADRFAGLLPDPKPSVTLEEAIEEAYKMEGDNVSAMKKYILRNFGIRPTRRTISEKMIFMGLEPGKKPKKQHEET